MIHLCDVNRADTLLLMSRNFDANVKYTIAEVVGARAGTGGAVRVEDAAEDDMVSMCLQTNIR
jgi:hypothetical protein